MSELVEPHPLLIEYYVKVQALAAALNGDTTEFKMAGEWHYIESNIEFNIFLLRRLKELDLLPKSPVRICDCGIGLGTIMWDLYLQSKEIADYEFHFVGIEKHRPYIDCFEEELRSYWGADLELIRDDLMAHNLSSYNFIWIFAPYNHRDKMMPFIEKVIDEMPQGAIAFGIDQWRIMEYGSEALKSKLSLGEFHKVDELHLFKKL